MSKSLSKELAIYFITLKIPQFIGLIPFKYNEKSDQFEESGLWLFYSICWLVFTAIYLPHAIAYVLGINREFQPLIVIFISHLVYCMFYVFVVGCYIIQIYYRSRLIEAFNLFLEISGKRRVKNSRKLDKLFYICVGLKYSTNLLHFALSNVVVAVDASVISGLPWHYAIFVKFCFTIVLQSIVNIFYVKYLLLRRCYIDLCEELLCVLNEFVQYKNVGRTNLAKMKVIMNLHEKFEDRISTGLQTRKLCINLNNYFQLQILTFLLHAVFQGCSQSYYMYMVSVGNYLDFVYIFYIFFIAAYFLDIFLLIFVTSEFAEGTVSGAFRRRVLFIPMEESIERIIDTYIFHLSCTGAKLQLCGLFSYRKGLALTITTYIFYHFLVLILFDKTQG